jgi:polar amino acid transport system substrate-binding protein
MLVIARSCAASSAACFVHRRRALALRLLGESAKMIDTPVDRYVLLCAARQSAIEGSDLVANNSPLTSNEQVDKKGIRIAVGKGSAYDLFLTREIKNAELQRAPTSPTTVDYFISEKLEVAAGVKQQLEMDAKRLPNLRLLPGRFMVIEQAMGLPKSRSPEAQAYLKKFVEEMKFSGFVAASLARHKIEGAAVAPALP